MAAECLIGAQGPAAAERCRILLGWQDSGEKPEERVVESFGLGAAAVHQRVDDPAHQNWVYRLGWRDKHAAEDFQEV